MLVTRHFVSEPLAPEGMAFEPSIMARGEPALPAVFLWHAERLVVAHVVRSWRSTKVDRGESYLKRHWFEFALPDGRHATVYFDRQARRGSARWWLYALAPADGSSPRLAR